MLIINADDYGRTSIVTDRTIECFRKGSVTSASAMLFMDDSIRAAELAMEYPIDLGLHLNLTLNFTQKIHNEKFDNHHHDIVKYLTNNKYNQLVYNPFLKKQFDYVFNKQLDEFHRVYGRSPSHIDGHHHMHLCANLLFSNILPKGAKIRCSFTFFAGEKSIANRSLRYLVDKWIARKHIIPEYFFSLAQIIRNNNLDRIFKLSKNGITELMTHPQENDEYSFLLDEGFLSLLKKIEMGTYSSMPTERY